MLRRHGRPSVTPPLKKIAIVGAGDASAQTPHQSRSNRSPQTRLATGLRPLARRPSCPRALRSGFPRTKADFKKISYPKVTPKSEKDELAKLPEKLFPWRFGQPRVVRKLASGKQQNLRSCHIDVWRKNRRMSNPQSPKCLHMHHAPCALDPRVTARCHMSKVTMLRTLMGVRVHCSCQVRE